MDILIGIANFLFPNNKPIWVFYLVVGLAIILIFLGIIFLLQNIANFIKEARRPSVLLDEETRILRRKRQIFANRVALELNYINSEETWEDDEYTELEAEIEAEDRHVPTSWWPFGHTRKGVHREKNLSIALDKTRDPLILLEGEPGSGKSVVLRHLTQKLAEKARKSTKTNCRIPLYINLKEININSENLSSKSISEYIFESMSEQYKLTSNQINFFEEELERGIQKGTWLFLFDSFDEIPEILQSTEVDVIIKRYAHALERFIHDGNCQGIIASRFFRGPEQIDWPRFKIQPLNEKRRIDLVKRKNLAPKTRQALIIDIENANDSIREMAKNPMFLSLLCDNVRNGKQFPDHIHEVYEDYINTRLKRDAQRLEKRFNISNPNILRSTCEDIAFLLTTSTKLGLSPTRTNLINELIEQYPNSYNNWNTLLDAIEFTRIGRQQFKKSHEKLEFSFAHRRFQEYFATCKVIQILNGPLENPPISLDQLFTDGRWRETAVTLLQIQNEETLKPILTKAQELLEIYKAGIEEIDIGYEFSATLYSKEEYFFMRPKPTQHDIENLETRIPTPIKWPHGLVHILGVLHEGLSNRSKVIPNEITKFVLEIFDYIYNRGLIIDKKMVIEFCGLLPDKKKEEILLGGLKIYDKWIDNIVFQQATKLPTLPPQITKGINSSLIDSVFSGRYDEERYATKAYIQRLPSPNSFSKALNMLVWMDPFDFILSSILISIHSLYILGKNSLPYIYISSYFLLLFLWLLTVFMIPKINQFVYKNRLGKHLRILFYFYRFLISALFFPMLLTFEKSITPEHFIMIIISLFIMSIFPSLYFIFIIRNKSIELLWWVFSPFILIALFLFEGIHTLQNIKPRITKWLDNKGIRLTIKDTIHIITLSILMLGFLFLLFCDLEQSSKLIEKIMWQFLSFFLLLTLSFLILRIYRKHRQFILHKNLLSSLEINSFLDKIELILHNEVVNINSPFERLLKKIHLLDLYPLSNKAFLIYIRENKLLSTSSETNKILQTLSTMIQFSHDMDKNNIKIFYKPKGDYSKNHFSKWLEKNNNLFSFKIREIRSSSLVELNRLIEQQNNSLK